MSRAFVRLTALVAGVALLTSRVMLLLHELGGHAAPAALFGGRVTGWYLFLFAGGRVSYHLGEMSTGHRLVVSLGGIAIELVVGVLAFALAARRRTRAIAAFALRCVGTVLLGHGGLYLARGVHYGFGDGALALAEIRWFPDPAWVRVMESASLVAAREELARRVVEAERRGEALPSAEEQQRMMDALDRARRPWPLDPVLVLAVVAGLVVGVTRGSREQRARDAAIATPDQGAPALPSGRLLGGLGAALGAALVLILVLRALAPP